MEMSIHAFIHAFIHVDSKGL